MVKIDPNVNVELISCDEGQFLFMTSYDDNVEGISNTYGGDIYNKEWDIQADQGVLFIPDDSNVKEYNS